MQALNFSGRYENKRKGTTRTKNLHKNLHKTNEQHDRAPRAPHYSRSRRRLPIFPRRWPISPGWHLAVKLSTWYGRHFGGRNSALVLVVMNYSCNRWHQQFRILLSRNLAFLMLLSRNYVFLTVSVSCFSNFYTYWCLADNLRSGNLHCIFLIVNVSTHHQLCFLNNIQR